MSVCSSVRYLLIRPGDDALADALLVSRAIKPGTPICKCARW